MNKLLEKKLIQTLENEFPNDYKSLINQALYIREEVSKFLRVHDIEINDYIIYSYKNHSDFSVEERKWYVYGAMFCSLNDKKDNYLKDLSREDFYKNVDYLCDVVPLNGNKKIIELGIDEVFFNNHIEQFSILDDPFYHYAIEGKLVGSELFRCLDFINHVEAIITTKYQYIKLGNRELNVRNELNYLLPFILGDSGIEEVKVNNEKDLLELYFANLLLKANPCYSVDLEKEKAKLLKMYCSNKKISEIYKGKLGETYIIKMMEEREKQALELLPSKIACHINDLKNKLNIIYKPIILEDKSVIEAYFDEYKIGYNIRDMFKSFEEIFEKEEYLKHAFKLVDDYFPEYYCDFFEKLSIVYGMLYTFNNQDKNAAREIENDDYFDIYLDLISDLAIPEDLDANLVIMGVDSALYDYYRAHLLYINDYFFNYLDGELFGSVLLLESQKIKNIYIEFKRVYPDAAIFSKVENKGLINIDLKEWVLEVLLPFITNDEYSLEECMEILSMYYFKNILSMTNKKDISNQDICYLYEKSNLIPEVYKSGLAFEILEPQYKSEKQITKIRH